MRGLDPVAIETALLRHAPDGHPRCALVGVAVHALGGDELDLRFGRMVEPLVVAGGLARLPGDARLDRAVVTRGARRGVRPERRARLERSAVARLARREELPVLLVIESLRGSRRLGHDGQAERFHRAALPPGMRRTAGGRFATSAPLPNRSTTRACTRS